MTAADDVSPGTIEPGRGYQSFAPVTEALMYDHRVTDAALRLWAVLDRQARGRPAAIDSLTKLSAKLGRGETAVRRAMQNLVETGWLDVHHRPGRVSRYVLHYEPPAPAADPNGGPSDFGGGSENGGSPPPKSEAHTRGIPSLRHEVKREAETPLPQQPPTAPAPAARPPTYVGRCHAHGDHPNPPPCGHCADARRARAAQQATEVSAQPHPVRCRTHSIDHAPNAECRSCRADRLAGDQPRPGPARVVERTWQTHHVFETVPA